MLLMAANKLKRGAVCAMAGILALSMVGCGKKKDEKAAEVTTEEATESTMETEDTPDYVAAGVTLPEDFDNMIYPLEALMVESASKGEAYYNENSDMEEADSFWFSMAVLSSLTNDYVKDLSVDREDSFLYMSEDDTDMLAATLYDSISKGNLEFPELEEDNRYAVYREEDSCYGFLIGDIGAMEGYITGCEQNGSDYVLTTELRDSESDTMYGEYEITLTKNGYDGDAETLFAYAVSDFKVLEQDDTETSTDSTEETDSTEDDVDSEQDTEEKSDSGTITQSEALERAKEYYGEDATYAFKEIVTIGDYDYYDFSVEGEGISSTDVLVSTDGDNTVGGIQNDDGSWSLDQ